MNSELIAEIELGTAVDAYEAAKGLLDKALWRKEVEKLANVARSAAQLHNREAAVYALSMIRNETAALRVFIDILSQAENNESLRGRAAEGIGVVYLTSRNKLKKKAEDALLQALMDSSPTVRFWSCYSVAVMKSRRAIPILQELVSHDKGACPGWWYVAEEAEDAVEKINGRDGKERIPVNER